MKSFFTAARFAFLAAAAFSVSLCSQAMAEPSAKFHIPSLYHVGFWVRDIAKSRAFYKDYLGFEEPYVLNYPDGKLQMVVMKVNERQVIYLFPNAAKILPNGDNLDHLGLETDNIAALREHLLAQGLTVGEAHRGRIGDMILGVKDPDGHTFEITEFTPEGQLLQHQGKSLPETRVSNHLRSASITISDLAASLHFYQDILGFKKVGGGTAGGSVRLQVPDGTDYLELIVRDAKADPATLRAVPDYCLDVPDAAKAAAVLASRAEKAGFSPPAALNTSADGEQQTSCVDPDGTRVVFKENKSSR